MSANENQQRKFRISGSDIKSMHKCEFRWYYERHLNLVPIGGWSGPMELGTKGHFIVEQGLTVLKNEGNINEAVDAATAFGLTQYPGDEDILKLLIAIGAFLRYFHEMPWRILHIEETQFVPHENDETEFAFTPDVVFEWIKGPLKGQQVIGDNKFTGQYWVDREMRMHQQVPRYIEQYNKLHGTKIKKGVLFFFNTRAPVGATGNKLWMPKWVDPAPKRFEALARETDVMIQRIQFLENLGSIGGEDFLKEMLVHTSDEKTCKMCPFADDLCPMDFDGRDTSRTLALNYKNNDTYGYNHDTHDGKPANG